MIKLQQVDIRDKRVLIRSDLNVSVQDGDIFGRQRILASLDSVRYALESNAAVMITSHFGRPTEGVHDPRFSLEPVARMLGDLLERDVIFARDWIDGIELQPGQVALCENVRFLRGEVACDPALGQKIADLCEVFVLDAFGTAHRDQASVTGAARFAETACAGFLFQHEVDSLNQALEHPAQPLVSIVGGAKVEGKLQALKRLSNMSQSLIVGGGIANTFLAARGFKVGNSLYEPGLVGVAEDILTAAESAGCDIPLPQDVVVAPSLKQGDECSEKPISDVSDHDMILDIGSRTRETYGAVIAKAGTVIWNGPVGAFEFEPFDAGTRSIAEAVAASPAFTAAGGGDTLAALEKFELDDRISYVSTGGGAFLEYVQGNELPAVAALARRATGGVQVHAVA